MIRKFINKLFGGGDGKPGTRPEVGVVYQDFEIRPAPVKDSNGWRVQGTILKESGDDSREHVFIRADACMDRESAVALTVRKARQLIDERGDKLFD